MVDLAVCKIAQSDHCNGAKKAIRDVKRRVKGGERMEELMKGAWFGKLSPQQQVCVKAAYASQMFEVGCQHHYRNIGCDNGEQRMDAILEPLLKSDVEKIRTAGIKCVEGKSGMALRTNEKYFGNTSKIDAFSAGPALKAHQAKQQEFNGIPTKAQGRVGISERQDGSHKGAFDGEGRRAPQRHFLTAYSGWGSNDNNFHKAITLGMDSGELETKRSALAAFYANVTEIHRTIVAKGGKSSSYDEPYVEEMVDGTKFHLASHGHLECYEVMHYEIIPYMERLIQNPKLLCSPRGWRECYTSATSKVYGEFNDASHTAGSGQDARDEPTDKTFWEWNRDHLFGRLEEEFKAGSKFGDLFDELVIGYATEFVQHIKDHDYGWLDKIENDHPDVAELREYSKYYAPYSKNESYFGLYKYMYEKNPEVCIVCSVYGH
jgi:hypothetical protein